MSVPRRRTTDNMDSDRPIYDMELPFDPDTLTQRAREFGFGRLDAAVFAHVALEKVRELAETSNGQPVSALQIAEAIKAHAAAEVQRHEEEETYRNEESVRVDKAGFTIWDDMQMELDLNSDPIEMLKELNKVVTIEERAHGQTRKRFKFSQEAEDDFFDGQDPYDLVGNLQSLNLQSYGRDLISGICQNVELAVELGKYLNAEDILNLYRANKAFYYAVNSYLMSSVRSWIMHHCPEAARVFNYKLYKKHLTPDPVGRSWDEQQNRSSNLHKVRTIPGLRYLQLVMGRDRYCSEILAIMARNGHRMPPTMHNTLLRLWLLMELSTSVQREALLRNQELWTDYDLYNAQFLFMKLGLHFNDPIYGPNTWDLLQLIMGQKGLYPLWQLLTRKKYKTMSELLELKVRYDFQVPPDHWGQNYFDKTIHGVPFDEVGIGHLEGWGWGENHLMRPDELIPMEAVARGLELDEHLTHMMIWGYFDWKTGENIVPSAKEMYITDEEKVLGDADTSHHWTPRHVLKKNFAKLSPELQHEIMEDDEDQRLRAMAWCGDNIDDHSCDEEDEHDYTLDDEIDRGFIVPHQHKDHKSQVPELSDKAGWMDFVNEAIMGVAPEIDEDEKLRSQSWNNYHESDLTDGWDWDKWLQQQQLSQNDSPTNSASSSSRTSMATTIFDTYHSRGPSLGGHVEHAYVENEGDRMMDDDDDDDDNDDEEQDPSYTPEDEEDDDDYDSDDDYESEDSESEDGIEYYNRATEDAHEVLNAIDFPDYFLPREGVFYDFDGGNSEMDSSHEHNDGHTAW